MMLMLNNERRNTMTTVQQSKLQKVTDLAKFNEMYEGSYYTITGAGGDLNEWVKGYEDLLSEAEIGTPIEWYSFTGKQMNEHYSLSGSKAYPLDLNFLSFFYLHRTYPLISHNIMLFYI